LTISAEAPRVFVDDVKSSKDALSKYPSALTLYKPTYILFYDSPVKFQFSLKYRVLLPQNPESSSGLYLGYTQKSLWDLWNAEDSSPLLTTDYNPEIFYLHELENMHFLKFYQVGIEHESNGIGNKNGKRSRSWDRFYIAPHFHFFNNHMIFIPKTWLPFFTTDNRDINKYKGYFKFQLKTNILREFYNSNIDISFTPGGTNDFRYASLELGYSSGPFLIHSYKSLLPLVFYMQVWHGYGEMLGYYRREVTKARIGLRLNFGE
jgi:outer membrane phospholipase A